MSPARAVRLSSEREWHRKLCPDAGDSRLLRWLIVLLIETKGPGHRLIGSSDRGRHPQRVLPLRGSIPHLDVMGHPLGIIPQIYLHQGASPPLIDTLGAN